ncbi:MAG: hypothetical protein JKY81_02125 [Colwellia sp.]|nr:hypothetical protein [Colwellia sp.]
MNDSFLNSITRDYGLPINSMVEHQSHLYQLLLARKRFDGYQGEED